MYEKNWQLCNLLWNRRQELGLSTQEVAERLNVPQQRYNMLETQPGIILDTGLVNALSEVLALSVDDIWAACKSEMLIAEAELERKANEAFGNQAKTDTSPVKTEPKQEAHPAESTSDKEKENADAPKKASRRTARKKKSPLKKVGTGIPAKEMPAKPVAVQETNPATALGSTAEVGSEPDEPQTKTADVENSAAEQTKAPASGDGKYELIVRENVKSLKTNSKELAAYIKENAVSDADVSKALFALNNKKSSIGTGGWASPEQKKRRKALEYDLMLFRAFFSGSPVTVNFLSVERVEDVPCALCVYGSFHIYIPVDAYTTTDMQALNEKQKSSSPACDIPLEMTVVRYLKARMGTYPRVILTDIVHLKNGEDDHFVAFASRIEAMESLRKERWFKRGSQAPLLNAGANAKATVSLSGKKGVRLELDGAETYVAMKDIPRVSETSDGRICLPNGTDVDIIVAEVEKDAKKRHSVEFKAIVKALPERTYSDFKPGRLYDGVVTELRRRSLASSSSVIVSVAPNVPCTCPWPDRRYMIPREDYRARVVIDSVDVRAQRLRGHLVYVDNEC